MLSHRNCTSVLKFTVYFEINYYARLTRRRTFERRYFCLFSDHRVNNNIIEMYAKTIYIYIRERTRANYVAHAFAVVSVYLNRTTQQNHVTPVSNRGVSAESRVSTFEIAVSNTIIILKRNIRNVSRADSLRNNNFSKLRKTLRTRLGYAWRAARYDSTEATECGLVASTFRVYRHNGGIQYVSDDDLRDRKTRWHVQSVRVQ